MPSPFVLLKLLLFLYPYHKRTPSIMAMFDGPSSEDQKSCMPRCQTSQNQRRKNTNCNIVRNIVLLYGDLHGINLSACYAIVFLFNCTHTINQLANHIIKLANGLHRINFYASICFQFTFPAYTASPCSE